MTLTISVSKELINFETFATIQRNDKKKSSTVFKIKITLANALAMAIYWDL